MFQHYVVSTKQMEPVFWLVITDTQSLLIILGSGGGSGIHSKDDVYVSVLS
jgi:hypothetical protein